MGEDPKRPVLRLITEADAPPPPPSSPAEPAPSVVTFPSPPTTELRAFEAATAEVDASIPIVAAYFVCAGCYLADAALAFYHSAAAHAPRDTFRHGVPPGLKSAEATRAWLEIHLEAVKALSRTVPGERKAPYERCRDLATASRLAAEELTRAYEATKVAGLWFEDRYAGLLRDATEDLTNVAAFVMRRSQPVETARIEEPPRSFMDRYVFGCDVLSNSGYQTQST